MPACHRKEEAEIRYIHTLRQALLDPDFYRQLEASAWTLPASFQSQLHPQNARYVRRLALPVTKGRISLLTKA